MRKSYKSSSPAKGKTTNILKMGIDTVIGPTSAKNTNSLTLYRKFSTFIIKLYHYDQATYVYQYKIVNRHSAINYWY